MSPITYHLSPITYHLPPVTKPTATDPILLTPPLYTVGLFSKKQKTRKIDRLHHETMDLAAAQISVAAGQTRMGNRPGLARLLTSSLQWGLAAGRTDSLVVAAVKLVEVVKEGEVVGLL